MKRSLLHAAVLCLVVLGFAGCGGGDDEETTATPTTTAVEAPAALSKEELIAQGDGICAEVNAAVGTVDATDSADVSQAVQVSDLYAGMVERLRGLGAPSDDSAGYDEFIAAAEQLAQAESDVQLAAERGEEEALTGAEADASSALASFQSAASAYGFGECSEGPSAPAPGTTGGAGAVEEPVEGVEEESESEEVAPEVEEEVAPEAGGAGTAEEGGAGGGATAGGGSEGGGEAGGSGESSGGIGPG
jgi:uncharacterized membrane protein YgcG